jgi:hypothetical protein
LNERKEVWKWCYEDVLFFAFGDVAEDEALQLAVVVFGVGFPEVVEEGFKVLIGF